MDLRKRRPILVSALSGCLFGIFAAMITAKNWALVVGIIIPEMKGVSDSTAIG